MVAGQGAALAVTVLCLLAASPAHGDLTARLVDDSDNMANIVGARETMSLVDYKLHKVNACRVGSCIHTRTPACVNYACVRICPLARPWLRVCT